MDKECYWCEQLEEGDTLYYYHSDDTGACYDYINDVKYCPKCGKRLLNYEEKYYEVKRNN